MKDLDIKSLASELKRAASGEKGKPPLNKKEAVKSRPATTKTQMAAGNDLMKVVQQAKERTDFELGHAIYIDSELHEILRRIKSQTKVQVGNLVSEVLEAFLLQHKEEVVDLIRSRKRRLF